MQRVGATQDASVWAGLAALLLGYVLGVTGCAARKDDVLSRPTRPRGVPRVMLTWKSFEAGSSTDPEDAVYVLDGRTIGAGRAGLEQVLRELEARPMGLEIYIFPDDLVVAAHRVSQGCGGDPLTREINSVPLRAYPDILDRLGDIAARRGMRIWYLAAPPGECVFLETGEDLRMPGP